MTNIEKFINDNKLYIDIIEIKVKKHYYNKPKPGRKLTHELRNIIEGIILICKTGVSFKYANYKGIDGSALKYHFDRWDSGIFYDSWVKVYSLYKKKRGFKYKKNLKSISIDATYIKSINGTDLVGKNPTVRGRNATKLSMIVDRNGVPIGYHLDKGNISDSRLFKKTIKKMIDKRSAKTNLYADKGYSNSKNKKEANEFNMELCCKNKRNSKKKLFKDQKIERHRYVVEAVFSWIKNYKRLILRYDKYIEKYRNFLLIAFSLITIKKFHP